MMGLSRKKPKMVRVTYSGTIGSSQLNIKTFYASREDAMTQIKLDEEQGRLGPDTRLGSVISIEEVEE